MNQVIHYTDQLKHTQLIEWLLRKNVGKRCLNIKTNIVQRLEQHEWWEYQTK